METIILVVNLLFGLGVNEIPNMIFILDSHWPLILQCWKRAVKIFYLKLWLLYILLQN
jgi:hypothetical protein